MAGLVRIIAVCWLLLLGGIGSVFAAEEIRDYDVRIAVQPDASLNVEERIKVNVEGRAITRGIFRDIPLRFEDASGRTREVDLTDISVTRDGQPERFTTKRESGVLRIRIGNASVTLPHGEHDYAISYRTTKQIRYFEDHDELYWNVTGNVWDFPILKARAEIRLPKGAQVSDVTFYTGGYGSTEQAASAQRLENGNLVVIDADRALRRHEGLTAVVAFPKGVVAAPSAEDLRAQWWRDNIGRIIGWTALVLVVAYYSWAWNRVGRDPPAGLIVPRWHPPQGVSPALANYIENRGFGGHGWDAFSASLLDLAVKGHVVLDEPKKTVTIRRTGSAIPNDLGIGQKVILKALPGEGDELTVNKSNGERVQKLGRAFRSAIEAEHRNRYYNSNSIYIVGGVMLSVLALVFLIAFAGFSPETVIGSAAAILPAAVFALVAISVGRRWRNARDLKSRIGAVLATAVFGLVIFNLVGTLFQTLTKIDFDLYVLSAVAGLVIANIVFMGLLGAPTPLGQKLSAEIKGLKQYLTVAEQERMNMQGAPEMSPQHFETLLPYAVALGVEKPWSKAFDTWLAVAVAAGTATAAYYGPTWYTGQNFRPGSIGSTMGNMAGSLSNSFTASLPTPKSSSSGFSSGGGGGGGFSGGGGGGGGGGGW